MPGLMTPRDAGAAHATDRDDMATVLLVDDEEDMRFLARMQLERLAGFEVVGEASDGLEAVQMAARLQPSAILLDVMMPCLDGYGALPELTRVCPRSMIVMVSALSAATHEQPTIAAGAFAFLEKDVLTAQLGEQLSGLMGRFRRALQGETVWAPEGLRP